jgi:LacI family transcriptional regulator/LacI family repressor for deo operon, udp, cdd, tsx, nupC, and nupG
MPVLRPTQKKVAALAGVHVSTVCLALKNHPSLPEKTCRRIQQIAAKIGYRPDPMLSALAAYRNSQRAPAFQGQLAWLSNCSETWHWRKVPVYVAYHEAAAQRALFYGYTLSDFNLGEKGMTARRTEQIFQARNIRGILVCPQPSLEFNFDFPWAKFSAVSLGNPLNQPGLHLVGADHYHSTQQIFRKLTALGYRRLGLALPRELDERMGGYFLAAFLWEQNKVPARHRVPAFVSSTSTPSARDFGQWLRHHRVDALLTTNYIFPPLLAALKIQVPEKLGVAMLFRKTGGGGFAEYAGMEQNAWKTGEVAVDYLVAMLHRNERGIPAFAQRILVEGRWVAGSTVRLQR